MGQIGTGTLIGLGFLGAAGALVIWERRARAANPSPRTWAQPILPPPIDPSLDALADPKLPGPPRASSDDVGPAIGSGAWVWPLPIWQGYAPVLTDGFLSWRTDASGKRIRHSGVDVMYERKNPSDQADAYPPGTPAGSARAFMPMGVPVLAVRDGVVWSAAKTPRGYAVVIDHGPPWASFYQHLDQMLVSPTQRGASKQRIRAGDVIGHVGADPTDHEGLRHLHFELWKGGSHEAAIDPAPLMKSWTMLPSARPPTRAIV